SPSRSVCRRPCGLVPSPHVRLPPPPPPALFPYTTLFRSLPWLAALPISPMSEIYVGVAYYYSFVFVGCWLLDSGSGEALDQVLLDRKSTRLNSSHVSISYAVFCLKKKTRAGCGPL